MLRELERDFFKNNPPEWGVMDRAISLVSVAMTVMSIAFIFAFVGNFWVKIANCLLVVLGSTVSVVSHVRNDRIRWRVRTGEKELSIDYIESCIEEEQARKIIEHPSVARQLKPIETEIRDIENLDRKLIDWRDPALPPLAVNFLVFLGTILFQKIIDKLLLQGGLPDALVGVSVGVALAVLLGIGYARAKGFVLSRSRRRRIFYRALVAARSFLENGRTPAPWLDSPKGKGAPVVSLPQSVPARAMKNRKRRR